MVEEGEGEVHNVHGEEDRIGGRGRGRGRGRGGGRGRRNQDLFGLLILDEDKPSQ